MTTFPSEQANVVNLALLGVSECRGAKMCDTATNDHVKNVFFLREICPKYDLVFILPNYFRDYLLFCVTCHLTAPGNS